MSAVIQALLIGIVVGALYSLVALGFGLIMGVMRFVNIAHGSFIIIGGYIAYWLFTLWGIDPYLSIPAVMVCMFVMGLLLYRLALAPLLKYPRAEMRMDKSLLITFGVTWVLDNTVTLVWTPDTRSVITSYSGSTIDVFGARLGLVGLTGLVIAVLIAVFLHLLLTKTYFGKHVRAATEDSGAAALSGVNVQRTYLISCGIASALAGVAAVAIASSYSIAPSGGLNWLLTAMVVIVLAGEGNITHILPAGLILGVLQSRSTLFVSPAYQQPISLIVFILVLMFSPTGYCAGGDEWPVTGKRHLSARGPRPFRNRPPRCRPGQQRHERHGDALCLHRPCPGLEPHRGIYGAGEPGHRGLLRPEHHDHPLPLESRRARFVAISAGTLSAVILALLIGLPTLRLRGMYFAVGTLALAQAAQTVVANIFTRQVSMPGSFSANYSLSPRYYLGLLLACASIAAVYVVARSRIGLAMVAIRDDEGAAQMTGVRVFRTR